TARSRSHEADGIRSADRIPWIARPQRIGVDYPTVECVGHDSPGHVADADEPDTGRYSAGESAGTLLSAVEVGREHARPGKSSTANRRRHSGPGAVWRTHPGSGDGVHPPCERPEP